MSKGKIALLGLNGCQNVHFSIEERQVSCDEEGHVTAKRHHLILVDRSCSMTPVLQELKRLLIKLLTLEEYRDDQSLVSVISYAGRGDLTLHCSRISLQSLMIDPQEVLSSIQTMTSSKGTCISEALSKALTLIRDDELSLISLHSDGYSLSTEHFDERSSLLALVSSTVGRPIRINTIAHSERSDFTLLSEVAELGGGVCIAALDLRAVYDALFNTSQSMIKGVTRPLVIQAKPRERWVLVCPPLNLVVMGEGEDRLLDLDFTGEASLYLFQFMDRESFEQSQLPELGLGTLKSQQTLLALSRSLISQRKLTWAKYALLMTRDQALIQKHLRALSVSSLKAFSLELEQRLLKPTMSEKRGHYLFNKQYLPSIIEVANLLRVHASSIWIDQCKLHQAYHPVTLKHISGTRDHHGQWTACHLTTRACDREGLVPLHDVEINQKMAAVRLTLSEQVQLYTPEGELLNEVAGIQLDDLRQMRSYCMISDGDLRIDLLWMKTSNRSLFNQLKDWGLVEGDFAPDRVFKLTWGHLPFISLEQPSLELTGLFNVLAKGRLLKSFLNAVIGDRSPQFTPDQVSALRENYISPSLRVNLPRCLAYPDLSQAILEGQVDHRTSYEIDLGNYTFPSLDLLPSASSLFKTTYRLVRGDTELQSPSLSQLGEGDVRSRKRLKTTPARTLLRPLMDELLGVDQTGELKEILKTLGVPPSLVKKMMNISRDQSWMSKKSLRSIEEARDCIRSGLRSLYRERLAPFVFYLSATGMLPDECDAQALLPEETRQLYPQFRLGKRDRSGLVFDLGEGLLITVRPIENYYTIDLTQAVHVGKQQDNEYSDQEGDQSFVSILADRSA